MKIKTNSFQPCVEWALCQHLGCTEENVKKAYQISVDATPYAYDPQNTIEYTIEIKVLNQGWAFSERYQENRMLPVSETIERIISQFEKDFSEWLLLEKSNLLRYADALISGGFIINSGGFLEYIEPMVFDKTPLKQSN